jgi:hypothetical protein
MAQWSLLGREPLPDFPRFPAIRYPGFSDGLRLIEVDPFLSLAFLNEINAYIPRLSARLVVSDRCPRADTGSTIADAHGDCRFFHSPPRQVHSDGNGSFRSIFPASYVLLV